MVIRSDPEEEEEEKEEGVRMSFFHQTITSDPEEEEDRVSFDSDLLACYKERLSSKEENEEEEEEEEEEEYPEEEEEEEKKPEKRVSFNEDVLVCPTYTREEYDREPEDDWQEKERLVEEAVERLDIVIVQSDPRLLLELVKFTDYHKMVDEAEDEVFESKDGQTPRIVLCDFGVYVEDVSREEEAGGLGLERGDMVLTLDEQDFLSSTAAQVKHHLARVGRNRVSLTLGRPRKTS